MSDGLPVELDGLVQWGVGDRMLRDLLAGRTRQATLGKEWRRGVLPPGTLGWRLAQKIVDQAAPVAEVAISVTQGIAPSARDVDVDLGGGRRLRGTVTDLYGDRVVKVSFSRLGPEHLLDAWVPLLALCADSPGRRGRPGAIGRGGFGRPLDRSAFASVEDAGRCSRPGRDLRRRHARAVAAAAEDRPRLGERQPAHGPLQGREAAGRRAGSASRTRTTPTSGSGA